MFKKTLYAFAVFTSLFLNTVNATNYYLVGSNIASTSSWWTSSDGTGSQPSDFTGSGHTWYIGTYTSTAFTSTSPARSLTNANFNVDAASTIVIVNVSLTVTSNGLLSGLVDVNSTGTLTISNGNAVNFQTLSSGSTVIFNSALQSVTARTYGNLTINQSISTSGAATNVNVNGKLTLGTGVSFNLNSKKLRITSSGGSIAGTGSLTGTSSSTIELYGGNGGNNGTLLFASSSTTLGADVSYISANNYIKLGNNLVIGSGGFAHDYGSLDLNGKTLEISASGDISFPYDISDGYIIPSGGSLLIYGSAGQGTGFSDLYTSSTSSVYSSIYLNNSGTSMGIGSGITITDSISAYNGVLALNGNVTLQANSSKTARIGRSNGTLSGNITVETYLPGTSTGWANLGTPGVSGQTFADWDTYVTSGGANGVPMSCSGCYYGLGYSNGFNSIYSWDEPAIDYLAATSTTGLTAGKGFWVYVGTGTSSTSALKLVNTGTPVSGPVTFGITKTTGSTYNLISNPYASPISFSKFRNSGSNSSLINNAVYVWNADLNSGSGAFATYISGVSNPSGSTGVSDIIPSGQGFYVEALSAGNLAFSEDIKMTNNTSANPVLRGAKNNYIGQVFRVNLSGKDGDGDQMAFRIHPMATPFFDGEWDAHKIFQTPGYAGYPGAYSKYTTISSKDPLGEDYSIHSFPEPSKDLTIPLLVRVMQSGTYTISASELENIPSCLILKDKLLNKTQDLQMGDYVFTISDTTSAPRFELQLCRGISATNSIAENKIDARSVQILKAEGGVQINTIFAENTRAKIEVFNLLGQSLYSAVTVDGTNNSTFIPVDLANNMILVKVSTDTDSYSKKVLLR